LSLKKNISFVFSAQILNAFISFLSSIIITRILGAEGRGEYTIFLNTVSFAVLFFGFSINSTISYFINSGKAKSEELLSTIIVFIIASSLLVYGSLYLLQEFSVLELALPGSVQSDFYKFIFTGIYFSLLLNGVLTAYLFTFKKFKTVSFFAVTVQVLPVIIYSLLYFDVISYDHENPIRAVVIAMAIVAIFTILAFVLLFIKNLKIRPAKKLIPFSLIKEFVLFSSLAYLSNVATFFNYKLDFWVIDEYWGKYNLGIYSLAAQLTQLLWILPQAIAAVLYSYASSSSLKAAIRHTIKLKQLAFYGSLILGITGIILSWYFIPILYGREFSAAFELVVIFMIGIIPFSIHIVLISLFAARGHFKITFIISIITLVFAVISYFTIIPRYGLIGGALSSASAYLLATVLAEVWFCKIYRVSIFNLLMVKKEIFSLGELFKKKK